MKELKKLFLPLFRALNLQLPVLVFVSLLLSLSPLLIRADQVSSEEDLKNAEANRRFEQEIIKIAKTLPATARLAVPEVQAKQINPLKTIKDKDFRIIAEELRNGVEHLLISSGVKVIDRSAYKHLENEIVLSQTGVLDPSTSLKFGKVVGATHIVLVEVTAIFIPPQVHLSEGVKFIETESLIVVGSTSVNLKK